MFLFHAIEELKTHRPLHLALGVFDGLHRGHQKVLQAAKDGAIENNGTPVVVTFDPHPAKITRPESPTRLLCSTPHKIKLLQHFGAPYVLTLSFDQKMAALEPEEFIAQLVFGAGSIAQLCVGEGWRFGSQRRGDIALLRTLAQKHHFTLSEIPHLIHPAQGGEKISSSRIREAVRAGDLALAAQLLGREYTVLGTVVAGRSLGKKLGFPTANLRVHNEQLPPNGVYFVEVDYAGKNLRGLGNLGYRPTVSQGEQARHLEIYLLDFSEDIYGENLEVTFRHYHREEKKFASTAALQNQITQDVASAQQFFK